VLRGLEINQHGLGPVVSSGAVEVPGYSVMVLVQ
jgi:hypothetical protein